MKNSTLFDIDLKEMRIGVRDQLTEKSQYVVKALHGTVSENLYESYTDAPMSGTGDNSTHYSKEDVRKMLQNWETPNENDSHYKDNMDNEYNQSEEGKQKLKDGDDNKNSKESDKPEVVPSSENTLRYMKDLYFRESEEPFYIDSDDDELDDDYFRNSLIQARNAGEEVELSLDDDNTIDLDSETINKILNDAELFKKVLGGLDSIDTITSILGVSVVEDNLEESETAEELPTDDDSETDIDVSEKPSGEIDPTSLKEQVYQKMNEMIPEAMYAIGESTFNRAPQDISKLVAKMQKTANVKSKRPNDKNRISRGRAAMVNRVRGGKLQMRKLISDSKGYKIVAGSAVRMKPSEIKNRRISARFASKKRRNMQASINRKTKLSIRFRHRRLD